MSWHSRHPALHTSNYCRSASPLSLSRTNMPEALAAELSTLETGLIGMTKGEKVHRIDLAESLNDYRRRQVQLLRVENEEERSP